MQGSLLTFVLAILIGGGILTVYAPDTLSVLFVVIMDIILIAGVLGGYVRLSPITEHCSEA